MVEFEGVVLAAAKHAKSAPRELKQATPPSHERRLSSLLCFALRPIEFQSDILVQCGTELGLTGFAHSPGPHLVKLGRYATAGNQT